MQYSFASVTILLILIMDPLGNIPFFINALRPVAAARRKIVVLREVAIAFLILLLFMVVGNRFLQLMSLTPISLKIAGGIVLFLISLRMIFPHPDHAAVAAGYGEPFIVPLAIPNLAGPSALATVMLLTSQAPGHLLEWAAALTVTMAVCAVVLMMAERLERLVGERTVMAFERLMGLVLVAIAVEMILAGVRAFVHEM